MCHQIFASTLALMKIRDHLFFLLTIFFWKHELFFQRISPKHGEDPDFTSYIGKSYRQISQKSISFNQSNGGQIGTV